MSTNQLKINLLEEEKQENTDTIAMLLNKINTNLYNIQSSESQIADYNEMNSQYEEQIQALKAENLIIDSMINDYTIPDYENESQTAKAN